MIDVDSHNFPNLPLMKISQYYKSHGDDVEFVFPLKKYDVIYQSKVFTDEYSLDIDYIPQADEIHLGGTGYGLENVLPDEIEHQYPDYSLYGISDTAYGFLTRGCPRACAFCIVADKEGRKSYQVADLNEFWRGQKNIKLLDPNILAAKSRNGLLIQLANSKACVDFTQGIDARLLDKDVVDLLNKINIKEIHFAWDFIEAEKPVLNGLEIYKKYATRKPHGKYGSVYVLTNFNTTHEQDLYRVYKLRDMGYDPYVMIFNKSSAPKITKKLQRWVNNKILFNSVLRFEDMK